MPLHWWEQVNIIDAETREVKQKARSALAYLREQEALREQLEAEKRRREQEAQQQLLRSMMEASQREKVAAYAKERGVELSPIDIAKGVRRGLNMYTLIDEAARKAEIARQKEIIAEQAKAREEELKIRAQVVTDLVKKGAITSETKPEDIEPYIQAGIAAKYYEKALKVGDYEAARQWAERVRQIQEAMKPKPKWYEFWKKKPEISIRPESYEIKEFQQPKRRGRAAITIPRAIFSRKQAEYPMPPISLEQFEREYFEARGWPTTKPILHRGRFISAYGREFAEHLRAADEEYARLYGQKALHQSYAGMIVPLVFAPGRAIRPEVKLSDITPGEWATGVGQIALWVVAPAAGGIPGVTGATARTAAMGTAATAFTIETALDWDEMSPEQRAISIAFDVLLWAGFGASAKELASDIKAAKQYHETPLAKEMPDYLKGTAFEKRCQNLYVEACRAYRAAGEGKVDMASLKRANDLYYQIKREIIAKGYTPKSGWRPYLLAAKGVSTEGIPSTKIIAENVNKMKEVSPAVSKTMPEVAKPAAGVIPTYKIGEEVRVVDAYGREITSGKVTKIDIREAIGMFRGKPVIKPYYQIEGKGLYAEELIRPKAEAEVVEKVAPEEFIPVEGMPSGTVKEANSINSKTEATREINREFYDAIKESALDVSGTIYLKTGDFDKFIAEMPAYKKLSIEEAEKLGVALRTTKAGNLLPAMRKSGFYVTTEFAQYPNFKDIGYVSGTWMDPDRMFRAIDGGFRNGMAQKYILWPTKRNILARLAFVDNEKLAYKQILEKWGMVGDKQSRKIAGEVIEHISKEEANLSLETLLKKKEIADLLKGYSLKQRINIVGYARDNRKVFDALIDKQNAARAKRAQETIPYRDNYRPWVIETNIWSQTFGLKKTPADVIKKPELPDYIKPIKPFNPRAMAREGGLQNYPLEKDLMKLTFDYIDTAGKDIFNTNIVHNAKIHSATLRSMGFENSARLIEDWAAECYAGVRPRISRGIREVVPRQAISFLLRLRRQLTRAVFPLNWIWNVFVQTSSISLTVARYGIRNTIGGVGYLFRPSIKNAVRKNAYSWIIKARRGGKAAYQDLGKDIEKTLDLEKTTLDKADDVLNYLTSSIEEKLTGISIEAARLDGMKRLGLKGRELWEYASEGGARTQSMYNLQDLPGVLRAREIGAIAPFQTFSFEVFNTASEIAGVRGLKTEPFNRRLKMLLEWIACIVVINAVADKCINRKPWQLSSFIPFYGIITKGLSNPYNPVGEPLPWAYQQAAQKGITHVLQYGDWRALRNWFIKYHTPGGIQIVRMMQGIEAVSEGKVTDVRGRMLFEVDPDEWLVAITMGPYQTRGGREYIKKLREAKGGTFYELTGISPPKKGEKSEEEIRKEYLEDLLKGLA